MREKPSIASLLIRLRKRARLSQRALAELSGSVSAATIARIEHGFDRKTGGPVRPEPDTLRGIALGLLTTDDGPPTQSNLQKLYRELLEVAGYDLPDAGDAPTERRAEIAGPSFQEEVAALLKQIPDASIALTDLSRGANDWDDDDREFVLGRLRRLAERYGKRQVAC